MDISFVKNDSWRTDFESAIAHQLYFVRNRDTKKAVGLYFGIGSWSDRKFYLIDSDYVVSQRSEGELAHLEFHPIELVNMKIKLL